MIGTPGVNLHAPGPIGDTTPSTLAGTTLSLTSTATQISFNYDGSHRGTLITDSAGRVIIDATDAALFRITGGGVTILNYSANLLQLNPPQACFQVGDNTLNADRVKLAVYSSPGLSGTGLGDGGATQTVSVVVNDTDIALFKSTGLALGPGKTAKVGGTIFDDFTDGATTHTDGTEDTLQTHTLQAGQFATNGDKITGSIQIAIVGHAVSTDRIRLYCAGTAIFDTTALNFPLAAQLTLEYMVIRVSASVLRASVAATTNSATVIAYSQYVEITALTLANTQIVALKAIATGTNSAAGDVTAKLGTIIWQPAA